MQNFRINEYSDEVEEQPRSEHLADTIDLGERISFINCRSGLLIATPRDSDDKLDYMIPVCLGFSSV